MIHNGRKSMVIDGRWRNKPTNARCFSFFFVVERVDAEQEKEQVPNMEIGYASANIDITFSLPNTKKQLVLAEDGTHDDYSVGTPIMYNPAKIPKHTKLVSKAELEMGALEERDKRNKVEEAKKAASEHKKTAEAKKEAKDKAKAEGDEATKSGK